MFTCAVGHSDDIDTDDAVADALAQCERRLAGVVPGAALVFCGVDYDHGRVARLLTSRYPGIALIGCTTDGELSSDHSFTEESVLVALLASDTLRFRSGVGHGISTAAAAATAAAAGTARLDDEAPALVFVVSDGLTASGDAVLRGLQQAFGDDVPIVGGAAGDKRRIKGTTQLHGDGVYHDSVAVLAVYGPLEVAFGVESGWEPLGNRVRVTRSHGHAVAEIDGRSALEFYRHYMGQHARGGTMPAYPLGIWPADARLMAEPFYVRSPIHVDEQTGTIIFSGEVPEGVEVQMMQVDRPNIVRGARASIAAAMRGFPGGEPAAVFVVSCTTRNEMLGTQVDQEAAIIREAAGRAPVFGFYAYGEYAPTSEQRRPRFHNETCVTMAFGER